MEWRGIQSAPRDGTRIILWAFRSNVEGLPMRPFLIEGRWVDLGDGGYWETAFNKVHPTNWMPRPEPPHKVRRIMDAHEMGLLDVATREPAEAKDESF